MQSLGQTRRGRGSRALAAGLLVTLTTACTGSPPTPSQPSVSSTVRPVVPLAASTIPGVVAAPAGHGAQRWTSQRLTWTDCAQPVASGARCARVLAPLDRSSAEQERAVTLTMAMLPATQQPRAGTIFINPGGPGGSGLGMLGGFRRTGLEHFDVVAWDPRGVGASTGVRCGDMRVTDDYLMLDQSPDDTAELGALREGNQRRGAVCARESGDLLAHVGSDETVADLELLRELLAEPRLNFFGYSYGTDLGSRYAHRYPDRVGRMVLDGAVSVPGGQGVSQAVGMERALSAFGRWCVLNRCGLGSDAPAVGRRVSDLLGELDARPRPTADGRRLTQSLAMNGVMQAFTAGEQAYPMLSSVLRQAIAGEGSELLALADSMNGRDTTGRGSMLAANDAVRCLDRPDEGLAGAQRDARDAAQQAPLLGPYLGVDLACPMWPVPARTPPDSVAAPGASPILVIGTTGDPVTPVENAPSMARQLGSGRVLIWDGQGHTAYGRGVPCVDEAVVRQLTAEPAPGDQRCG